MDRALKKNSAEKKEKGLNEWVDAGSLQRGEATHQTILELLSLLSLSNRDYIEAMHHLSMEEDPIRTFRIAQRLSVKTPSAVQVLSRFQKHGLAKKYGWGKWNLTPIGKTAASIIASRRSFLSFFLQNVFEQTKTEAGKNGRLMEAVLDSDTLAGFADLYVEKVFGIRSGKKLRKKTSVFPRAPLSELDPVKTAKILWLHKGFRTLPGLAGAGFLPETPVSRSGTTNKRGDEIIRLAGTIVSLNESLAKKLEVIPLE